MRNGSLTLQSAEIYQTKLDRNELHHFAQPFYVTPTQKKKKLACHRLVEKYFMRENILTSCQCWIALEKSNFMLFYRVFVTINWTWLIDIYIKTLILFVLLLVRIILMKWVNNDSSLGTAQKHL